MCCESTWTNSNCLQMNAQPISGFMGYGPQSSHRVTPASYRIAPTPAAAHVPYSAQSASYAPTVAQHVSDHTLVPGWCCDFCTPRDMAASGVSSCSNFTMHAPAPAPPSVYAYSPTQSTSYVADSAIITSVPCYPPMTSPYPEVLSAASMNVMQYQGCAMNTGSHPASYAHVTNPTGIPSGAEIRSSYTTAEGTVIVLFIPARGG